MHRPTKFCASSFIQFRVIGIFRNPRWRPPPSCIYKSFKFATFRHVNSVLLELNNLYQIWFKYLLWSPRWTHLCSRCSFDDVTRINFRLRLLVTWSSLHGRGASSHIIWCRYLYPVRSYLHFFPKLKMAAAAILDFQVMWIWPLRVLIVWNLCYVPYLVQIPVIVTEIDAHTLQTFIWWRHAN